MLLQIKDLLKNSISVSPDRATAFFKTGAGQYAEHDVFIGVPAPSLRKIAKDFKILGIDDLQCLLMSKINEERFLSLIILIMQYQQSNEQNKENIYRFYLQHLQYVNNWNLVDASAHLIVGAHLEGKDKSLLFELIKSNIMWELRIAIVSTWHFIKCHNLEWTFKIAELLLKDTHDLIHKAVGWMLREAGKRNKEELIKFLDIHSMNMPRTMLRYAIEKFLEGERKAYLLKKT